MKTSALPIASPCAVDWRSMTPADKGRFCGECKKVVHDLSRMSERDATALLQGSAQGDLCVRYVYDAQGRVFFAGEPRVPASLLNRARRAAATAATLALAACSGPVGAQGGTSQGEDGVDPRRQEMHVNMGAPMWVGDRDAGADGGEADASAEADAGADAGADADGGHSPF